MAEPLKVAGSLGQVVAPERHGVHVHVSSVLLVTLGHLMGIGGWRLFCLNVHWSGTGTLVAKLNRGHSRMSGALSVNRSLVSRGRDWAS